VRSLIPYDLIVAPGDEPFSVCMVSVAIFLIPHISVGERDNLIEMNEMSQKVKPQSAG
jgi:hypothetical protein